MTGAQAIASIAQSAFAELGDGSVMTWGNNDNGDGELGNGTQVYEATPVPATWLDKNTFLGGTVASGSGHKSYHGFAIHTVIHVIPINP